MSRYPNLSVTSFAFCLYFFPDISDCTHFLQLKTFLCIFVQCHNPTHVYVWLGKHCFHIIITSHIPISNSRNEGGQISLQLFPMLMINGSGFFFFFPYMKELNYLLKFIIVKLVFCPLSKRIFIQKLSCVPHLITTYKIPIRK